MSLDEAALVQRCLRGDPEAVRTLVETFQTDVFSICLRLLHHRQDAEDVTQEVFIRAYRSLRRWDPARPLKPWITAITINRCRTWLGRRGRMPESSPHLAELASAPTDDTSLELLREITAAVDELRPDYRTVFVLFHHAGQAYEDIARSLNRPVGTIKTWLHRARQEVLERLRSRGMVPEVSHEVH